jgi:carbonic anhydrase
MRCISFARTLFKFNEDQTERFNTFVEVNVKNKFMIYQNLYCSKGAWRNGQEQFMDGFIWFEFRLCNRLEVNMSSNADLDEVYQLKF